MNPNPKMGSRTGGRSRGTNSKHMQRGNVRGVLKPVRQAGHSYGAALRSARIVGPGRGTEVSDGVRLCVCLLVIKEKNTGREHGVLGQPERRLQNAAPSTTSHIVGIKSVYGHTCEQNTLNKFKISRYY